MGYLLLVCLLCFKSPTTRILKPRKMPKNRVKVRCLSCKWEGERHPLAQICVHCDGRLEKAVAEKRKLVIYHYYVNYAAYLDGKLLLVGNEHPPISRQMANALGFDFEQRNVDWENMPNYKKQRDTGMPYAPPVDLVDVETHIKALKAKHRKEQIAIHRSELERLEKEDGEES